MRRRLRPWKIARAFLTCSGTEEAQFQARLFAGASGQLAEELALALGIHPLLAVEFEVKTACPRSHPDFLQRLLQVDDDLAAVGKCEGDHTAHALVVDVCIGVVVDAVTGGLYSAQGRFGVVQVFVVVHYNAIMINMHRILGAHRRWGRTLMVAALFGSGLLLSACGQKGPLYLPSASANGAQPAPPAGDAVKPGEKPGK